MSKDCFVVPPRNDGSLHCICSEMIATTF